ncbi:MAG: hypothetical protein FJ202_06280 [Gemmatimonadetes bacterium]|nr:hypothetical protein [Gemmatimonadota bacterium]
MRLLWKLMKVAVLLAIVVPVAVIALAMTLGIFSAAAALAFLLLRVAVIGLVVWGVFRLVFGGFRREPKRPTIHEPKPLPPVDPYYEAAMRDLSRELGETPKTR